MPILFHSISTWVFILSGVVAVITIGLFIMTLRTFSKERFVGKAKWLSRFAILIILVGVNVLYFYNLIPPIPLSLKDGGIYQSFIVNSPGNYTAQAESEPWWSYFEWRPTVHVVPGTTLYAYTAVFAPTKLSTNIVHQWQYYDGKEWVTRSRVVLNVSGGGDNGWRTFSLIENAEPGAWRVNVETQGGALIGQLRFDVQTVTSTPPLVTTVIN